MPVGAQTTVDASARQAKAADFTPVRLPAIDPALLQATVSTTRPAPATPSIELQYTADPVPFVYPYDSGMTRWITVTNTGAYTELQFDAVITGPNGFSITGDLLGVTPHPQPAYLYLQPNESRRIWVCVAWNDLDQSAWTNGGVFDYRYDIRVYPKLAPGTSIPAPSQVHLASLHNSLSTVLPPVTDHPIPNQPMPGANATISGTVTDRATGKPVAGARVQLMPVTATNPPAGVTDASGAYSIAVVAFAAAQTGIWEDYGVEIQASGYAGFHAAVAPHTGDIVRVDAALTAALTPLTYTVKASTDTVLNLYASDRSADGSYIALTPFHTSVPAGVDSASYLAQARQYFFGADGTALWSFPVYAETTAVAVSDDGSLVATTRSDTNRSDCGVYLLDHSGNVVWFVSPASVPSLRNSAGDVLYKVWEVRISHDNRYLAMGDTIGNFYLYDIASKKLLWQSFLNGQVRGLAFAADNATIYASSGDGYLYSFNAGGTLSWRTYVGAWTLSIGFSRNYILLGGKEGYYAALLQRSTGEILWEYPVVVVPFGSLIAPDESYVVLHGAANSFGTLLLDIHGVLYYHDDVSEAAYVTPDSAYIVLTGQDGTPGDKTSSWVRMIDRAGRQIWKTYLDPTVPGPKGYAWISNDLKTVAAANGSLFYSLSQVPTPTLSASPATISLNFVPGGTCGSQTVSISSTAPASGVAWSATSNTSTSPNWLTLSAASGTTPASLTVTCAGGGLQAGTYQGTVTIVSGSLTAPVPVTLTVGSAVDSVVSAAGGDARLAPGQIVSIYGHGLAGATGIPVTDAAGVSRPATLFFVSAGQINAMIPEGTAVGAATLAVSGQSGSLGTIPIQIGPVAPALFTVGNPPNAPVAAYAFYYSLAGQLTGQPAVFQCDASGSCAAVPLDLSGGDQLILSLYGTGIHHGNKVTCQIGSTGVTVLGAATTQFPGEDQVNVLVPQSLAGGGTQPIMLTVDGVASSAVPVAFK